MKKFDYYYACAVGKMLTASELLLKAVTPVNAKGLAKEYDVAYGNNKSQKIDIFYPLATDTSKRPIMFYIHGGGFISGTTALRRTYCSTMAKQGFFVVNVGYELAPKSHFPNQLQDIYKAIDFVLDRAEQYNLDRDKIVIAGESAGAYFASFIAAITCDKSLYRQNSIDFQHINEFKVGCTVLINGAYSINEILKAKAPFCKTYVKAFFDLTNKDLKDKQVICKQDFSPLGFIKNDYPPTVVIRGKYDAFDLGTKTLLNVLDSAGANYSLYRTKGIAGLHAVCIIPISKDAVRSQKFTVGKIKEYLNIDDE